MFPTKKWFEGGFPVHIGPEFQTIDWSLDSSHELYEHSVSHHNIYLPLDRINKIPRNLAT